MTGKCKLGMSKLRRRILQSISDRFLQITKVLDLRICFFTGGLVGYFSYDYLGYSEPSVRCRVEDSEAFKDVDLMLFDKVIAFDHVRQKIILIVNMSLDDIEVGYNKTVLELKQLVELLKKGEKSRKQKDV